METPTVGQPWGKAPTPYAEMGGDEAVRRLAEAFYDRIEAESPLLRTMLPRNTTKTREKFFMYLSGWLGGPPLYEMKWGHPRLRMRHMPFKIDDEAAEEWMRCMRLALADAGVAEPARTFLETRFHDVALHMRNQ